MQIKVDRDVCETHGLCAMLAPEVFRLDADRKLTFEASPDKAVTLQVREAAAACPVQAISIEDDK